MKLTKIIGSAALLLMLGTGAAVYGQQEEQRKPEKPEAKPQPEHAQQPKPQPERAQQPKPQPERAQQPKPQPERAQQAKPQPERAQQPKPQPERAQQAKPQPERAQQGKPQPTPQHAQSAEHQSPAQHQQGAQQSKPSALKANYAPPQRTRQEAQTWQKQSSWRQDGAWQGHASWQQERSSNWQSDHRTWDQRGGYGGYYIPQASFGLHFGVGNWFRIQSQPVIVNGYPQFQYGGYSFLMVDPWPSDWAQDWYASDDVYVGFDNGYYLYNRQFPGEAIAVTVML